MLGADAVPMRNVRSVIEAKAAHENLGGQETYTFPEEAIVLDVDIDIREEVHGGAGGAIRGLIGRLPAATSNVSIHAFSVIYTQNSLRIV